MLNALESSFNFGSGTVSYKGTVLGESKGSITIKRTTSIHEVKVDSSSNIAIGSIVTGVKLEISMDMIVSQEGIDRFFNREYFLQSPPIGTDLNKTFGELVIQTGKEGNQTKYTFPYAIIHPDFSCEIGNENHLVKVMFFTFIEADHMNVKVQ